ncbi:MAG: N-acetylglutaminylglutamine synthetase [Rhodospirillaceae bacterium]
MTSDPDFKEDDPGVAPEGKSRRGGLSLKHWGERPELEPAAEIKPSVYVDCGWGRLIFGQTFTDPAELAEMLMDEKQGARDVAFYVREPHVVLARNPQALFLDPSHSYRLALPAFEAANQGQGLSPRAALPEDEKTINCLYHARNMVPLPPGYCGLLDDNSQVTVLVARDGGRVAGVVMGVDHRRAFADPDHGSSLWALAVDPQAERPGVGVALVEALALLFKERGRAFMDLSVLHDNSEAIALYEKLGFARIPVYCVKRKNPINEKLFIGPAAHNGLNIYAGIIVDEARRRGIAVEIEDAEAGLFTLSLGGRCVSCRESLSDFTSAVAMSRCDDKALTHRLLAAAGLDVPDQITAEDDGAIEAFLARHRRVVVKPARGEQGHGVAVDLTTMEQVRAAVAAARAHGDGVVVEQFVAGQDLRIVVINGEVVAAAIRRPPLVRGDGDHTVIELIDKQSRRRAAATDGESRIPLDEETERSVHAEGYRMLDVPPEGARLPVRKTANLHSGGTIHDVTASLHPVLAEAALGAARALRMPVVGLDLMVPDVAGPHYVIIEANERPGLANHEPPPPAERFIDRLFPETRDETVRDRGTG